MTEHQYSHIADLRFAEVPLCDFARLISELDALLARICGTLRQLTWDCDDIAIFDMPGTRILLAFTETEDEFHAARLVVSVGPSTLPRLGKMAAVDHAAMCHRIVNRITDRCPPDSLHWDKQSGIMTAEAIDQMDIASPPHHRRPEIFSAFTQGPGAQEAELQALRAALHPYGRDADLPAATALLIQQSTALALGMVQLPLTALHFAASFWRVSENEA